MDWNKSSKELAAELNRPYNEVCAARKVFGHHKIGTYKTRHIDWENLDWTKNNQELSGITGFSSNVVSAYRLRLNKPPSPSYQGWKRARKITPDALAAVDWEGCRDITIAKQLGVTRERVRQIRLVGQYPKCKLPKHTSPFQTLSDDFREWIKANKESIEGKLAAEVAGSCPINIPKHRKYQLLKESGVNLVWRRAKTSQAVALPVNWDLPNIVICAVWNKNKAWAAMSRYEFNKPKPKWFISRTREGYCIGDDLRIAILEERDKVIQLGITPKHETLKSILE